MCVWVMREMMTEMSFWLNYSFHLSWFFFWCCLFKDHLRLKDVVKSCSLFDFCSFCNEQQPLPLCWVCSCHLFLATGTLYLVMLLLLRCSVFLQLCLRCHGDGSCIEVSESVCVYVWDGGRTRGMLIEVLLYAQYAPLSGWINCLRHSVL